MPRYDLDYTTRYDLEHRRPWRRRFRTGGYGGRRQRFRGRERERFEREPRTYGRGGGYGFERERFEPEYGREYTGYGLGRMPEEETWGYGREYGKTEWETDYGDPFRDRERGTPIRMIRGGWSDYGREYYGRERGMGRGRPRGRGRGYGYEYEYRPWRTRRY